MFVIPVTSVENERVFSKLNRVHTRFTNRLSKRRYILGCWSNCIKSKRKILNLRLLLNFLEKRNGGKLKLEDTSNRLEEICHLYNDCLILFID